MTRGRLRGRAQAGAACGARLLVVLAAALSGCMSGAGAGGMVPASIDVAARRPQTVRLEVVGGGETQGLDRSRISDAEFTKALAASILKFGVFSGVVETGGDYVLTVILARIDQPISGIRPGVRLEAGWKLRRAGSGETLWKEVIYSRYSDVGFQAATEGAARENIAEALGKLSRADLEPPRSPL